MASPQLIGRSARFQEDQELDEAALHLFDPVNDGDAVGSELPLDAVEPDSQFFVHLRSPHTRIRSAMAPAAGSAICARALKPRSESVNSQVPGASPAERVLARPVGEGDPAAAGRTHLDRHAEQHAVGSVRDDAADGDVGRARRREPTRPRRRGPVRARGWMVFRVFVIGILL